MKKILILTLAFALLASSLYAGFSQCGFFMTGGYSTVNNSGTFGTDVLYSAFNTINSSAAFGASCKGDIYFGVLPDSSLSIGVGAIFGPAFALTPNKLNVFSLTLGGALICETLMNDQNNDYIGLGVGIDASYTFYFNAKSDVGLMVGVSDYFMFADIEQGKAIIKQIPYGYIGISFKGWDSFTDTAYSYLY